MWIPLLKISHASRITYTFYVHSVSQVFHRFAENRVAHQHVKFLFEVILGPLPDFRVHPDVRPHPAILFELKHPMHSLLEIELQVSVVSQVVLFVLQCKDKLLALLAL